MSLKQKGSSKSKKKNLHVTFKAKDKIYNNNDFYTELQRRRPELQDCKLIKAASVNNSDRVKELLEEGADPNSTDTHFRSALHIATSRGFVEIIQLLLHYGADPNIQDVLGNTPLHLAACTNNLRIITILLNGGADVSSLDTHGRNPLQMAQSKLQLLQRNKRNGAIEMPHLKAELQQIIDIMISMKKRQQYSQSDNVEDLEMIKLSLNQDPDDVVEDQMSRLMAELQGFSIK